MKPKKDSKITLPEFSFFKLLVSVCLIIATICLVYFFFYFLPAQARYSQSEARRVECKQDVQGLYNTYNQVSSTLENNEENQQALLNYAVQMGLIDASTGEAVDKNILISNCLNGIQGLSQ